MPKSTEVSVLLACASFTATSAIRHWSDDGVLLWMNVFGALLLFAMAAHVWHRPAR